ncbi:septum site-determining protein (chloroplast) [Galdieria partita]|uniref:Putative septum site-determining protein MinD n=1 Tax=Galdieria partita TaxID=83374 RepID=A0A9C7C3B3_9RHOD|nr:septum site-determining protein [Galdieria partita]
MARVIVITSGKGGVGKTTTTANLGMCLAKLGYETILIDADTGLRNLDLLLGLENRVIYTALEVVSGECRLEQALIKDKHYNRLSLLSTSQNHTKNDISEDSICFLINLLHKKADYILIDSPAGIEKGFYRAISSAKEALVITTPEITSVRDADRVIGLLQSHNINNISLIINRIRHKMIRQNEMMSVQDVTEVLAIPLVGVIPEDEKVIISTNKGEPIVLEEHFSVSSLAFEDIARRLNGQDIGFKNLDYFYPTHLEFLKKIFFKSF